MRRLFKLVFISCLVLTFLFLFNPTDASAQRGILEGSLFLDGQPVNKAQIEMVSLGSGKKLKMKTKKNGKFMRGFIPIGPYKVTVYLDDKPVWENVVSICSPGTECLNFRNSRVLPPIRLQSGKKGSGSGTGSGTGTSYQTSGGIDAQRYKKLDKEFQSGINFLKSKNYREAVKAFKAAVVIDPKQHVYSYFLARAYRRMGRYPQSVINYKKAISLLAESKNSDVKEQITYNTELGISYAMWGKAPEAFATAEKAVKLNPKRAASTYYRLAAGFVQVGSSRDAVTAFKKSLKANPKNAIAHYQLAVTLVSLAKVTEAGQTIAEPVTVEAYKAYLKLEPNGQHADEADSMIMALSQKVDTSFSKKKGKK